MKEDAIQPQAKRVKLSSNENGGPSATTSAIEDEARSDRASALLNAPISPPAGRDINTTGSSSERSELPLPPSLEPNIRTRAIIPSPIQLTRIAGLAPADNVDTVSLGDIIGNPLIRECWAFNYLFDVDFLLSNLDEDVRESVEVYVVHGSWKKEDPHRIRLDDAASRHKNVKAITAYMPEAFGTHHSKMMVLVRHDDTAEVVIFTANILPQDWNNMTQAVWRSPRLPLKTNTTTDPTSPNSLSRIGTGARFKSDLIAYLKTYGSKLKTLTKTLDLYDFSEVRAALVASTPGRQNLRSTNPDHEKLWGWPGLKHALQHVAAPPSPSKPRIVIQVSSVATLGVRDDWLRQTFFKALGTRKRGAQQTAVSAAEPEFSIVFPTPDEIRRSIDGYNCGGSIHWKLQSAQNAKQLQYMRPMLCHWAGDQPSPSPDDASLTQHSEASPHPHPPPPARRGAGRRRVGPHIKTYLRFSDDATQRTLDWALLTSANLSKQAWGTEATAEGDVRVCSYEIGVLLWPELWREGGEGGGEGGEGQVEMVPTFKTDLPPATSVTVDTNTTSNNDKNEGGVKESTTEEEKEEKRVTIGLRMPYDLPLVPYAAAEAPWCATMAYTEPDWKGGVWGGY